MTAAFIAHSPDYVIELFVNYGEYGETVFGQEKRFGLDAQQWIDAHYQLVVPDRPRLAQGRPIRHQDSAEEPLLTAMPLARLANLRLVLILLTVPIRK
jgi:hypothetical protein